MIRLHLADPEGLHDALREALERLYCVTVRGDYAWRFVELQLLENGNIHIQEDRGATYPYRIPDNPIHWYPTRHVVSPDAQREFLIGTMQRDAIDPRLVLISGHFIRHMWDEVMDMLADMGYVAMYVGRNVKPCT